MLKLKAAALALILAAGLGACADGRVAFGPVTGSYEIMLDGDAWETAESQSNQQLLLIHEGREDMTHGLFLVVDYYRKSELAGLGAHDFESFIRFFKTFSTVMEVYENEENSVHDLLALAPRDIRGSSATSGKRQQVSLGGGEPGRQIIMEYIFLETEYYYFALHYSADAANFNQAQELVGDVVRNIRVLK